MSKKMKFVVRSTLTSKIFPDIRSAFDACRAELGRVCKSSMARMRLVIDGRMEIKPGVSFIFFNGEVDKPPGELSIEDTRYVQVYVCEEAT